MKILVDLRKLSEKPSGIGMYTYKYIDGLLEYTNIQIIGITDVLISDEIKYLNQKNIEIICYNKKIDKNFEVFKYFNFIKYNIKKIKPDIFWEPNNLIPKNIRINNNKTKIMVTIHDIFPITKPEFYSRLYTMYFTHCIKSTIDMCDIITYVSEFTKNQVNSKFVKAINKTNFITYNIVDKNSNNLKIEDKNYYLYIGNIEKRKGSHLLLDAYKKYRNNGGKRELILAGNIREDDLKQKISNLIKLYPLNFKYYGYISENTKWDLLSKCSAFIFPSYAEGFGIPPIEALNIGKQVLVSNLSIFHEIIKNNCNYFILDNDYNSSIENLVKQLELLDINSNNANLFKIDYSKIRLTKDFVEFLLRIDT